MVAFLKDEQKAVEGVSSTPRFCLLEALSVSVGADDGFHTSGCLLFTIGARLCTRVSRIPATRISLLPTPAIYLDSCE